MCIAVSFMGMRGAYSHPISAGNYGKKVFNYVRTSFYVCVKSVVVTCIAYLIAQRDSSKKVKVGRFEGILPTPLCSLRCPNGSGFPFLPLFGHLRREGVNFIELKSENQIHTNCF